MTAPMDLYISLVLVSNWAVKLNLALKSVSCTHNINLPDPHSTGWKAVIIGLGLWTRSTGPKLFQQQGTALLGNIANKHNLKDVTV